MAEILSYDPAGDPEVVGAMEADQAESLAIGEEMINQAEARLAGKYKDAQELEKAYIELEKKLGSKDAQQEETADHKLMISRKNGLSILRKSKPLVKLQKNSTRKVN